MTDREQVKRYEPYTDEGNREGYGRMEEFGDGDWVEYEDYERLLRENERLRAALEDVDGVGFSAPMTWVGTDAEWERKRANAMQFAARAALTQEDEG